MSYEKCVRKAQLRKEWKFMTANLFPSSGGHRQVNNDCLKSNIFQLQVVDDEGYPVEVGEKREIWIRSPVAFRGYYGNIEKTKQTITENGWIKTGDIGKLSADGYLTMLGRIKEIIIRNGFNIHPSEVESLVITHPAVNIAQVIPILDYRVGEDVCACVTLNEGFNVTEEELKTFFEGKMSDLIQPSYFLIFDSFPAGASGKVDRKKLQEMAIGRIKLPEMPYEK
ncbi:medium-chain acyl-CoA ligase ACSF2, mitochondrial-like [Antedon mediterranea]|uniref:medium-chain acyl-CoA ligase ACSF2, mitochondrial-like n=1 Tax=Antedon mediterranea TaxID=105859 RepID=UPI003AF9BD07